jgi:hypothetical protein
MMMKIHSHNFSKLCVLLAFGAYHQLPGMDPLRLFEIKEPGVAPGLVNPKDYAAWLGSQGVFVEAEISRNASEHQKKPEFKCNGCGRQFKFYYQLTVHNHFISSAAERARLGIKCSKAQVRKGHKICQCTVPNGQQQPCGVCFTMRMNCISHIVRKHNKSRLAAAEFILDFK